MSLRCDLILPCRDEAAALVGVLADIPDAFRVVVVDNGSTDGTAAVAERLGAMVVREGRAGYGAAVQAGVESATAEFVAVMDADGSMRASDLLRLLDDVVSGRADLATGVRRPIAAGVWPLHARWGNKAVLTLLHLRAGIRARDIAAMRVCRRDALLELGVRDRRFGYPLELLIRSRRAGWVVSEHDIDYLPRAAGTVSKVSGSVRGSLRVARDFAGVLR